MGLTVRDLLDLNILKNFRLVAGEGGLDRPISGQGVEFTGLSCRNSLYMRAYMEEYLGPILAEGHEDLFSTARAYIMSSGDVVKTAEKLFCHKNTVRYRMSRVQKLIDPESNDKTFYESLSIAMRIYMLSKFNRW